MINVRESDIKRLSDSEKLEVLKLMEELERRKNVRNEVYSVIERFKGRYVILIGGSGSGKSYDIADYIAQRAVSEDGARFLCVRKQHRDLSESVFPLIENRLTTNYQEFPIKPKRAKGDEEIVVSSSRAKILFSGLDNVGKLKSIFDIASVWVEEADQVDESDVTELDRRLRGYPGKMQIYFTFNPVSQLSWIKKRFFDDDSEERKLLIGETRTGLSIDSNAVDGWSGNPGEYLVMDATDGLTYVCTGGETTKRALARTIAIRGKREFNGYPNYKDIEISDDMLNDKVTVWSDELGMWTTEYRLNRLIIHTTYMDNKFMDAQYYQTMEEMSKKNPDEYLVYGLGHWGIVGQIFFDKGNVNKRIREASGPIKRGAFEYDGIGKANDNGDYILHEIIDGSIRFVEDDAGPVSIYTEPDRKRYYVGGGDTSGEGSDYNTLSIIDNYNGEDVATIRTQLDEDEFARQLYCIGKYYGEFSGCGNDTLMAIEINYSTHPLKELQRLGYSHLYVREESPDKFTGNLIKRYGFHTNAQTRPLALGVLRTVVRERPNCIKDLYTLNEMTTFIKNEKGRPEAAAGTHDDMIMARAICEYVRDSQRKVYKPKPRFNIEKLSHDHKNDYLRADKAGKEYLRNKWINAGLFEEED